MTCLTVAVEIEQDWNSVSIFLSKAAFQSQDQAGTPPGQPLMMLSWRFFYLMLALICQDAQSVIPLRRWLAPGSLRCSRACQRFIPGACAQHMHRCLNECVYHAFDWMHKLPDGHRKQVACKHQPAGSRIIRIILKRQLINIEWRLLA